MFMWCVLSTPIEVCPFGSYTTMSASAPGWMTPFVPYSPNMRAGVVDVSSIKLLVNEWYRGRYSPPPKRETHSALADIEESIAELAYYRGTVFVKR